MEREGEFWDSIFSLSEEGGDGVLNPLGTFSFFFSLLFFERRNIFIYFSANPSCTAKYAGPDLNKFNLKEEKPSSVCLANFKEKNPNSNLSLYLGKF
jgi:hypothetical protein